MLSDVDTSSDPKYMEVMRFWSWLTMLWCTKWFLFCFEIWTCEIAMQNDSRQCCWTLQTQHISFLWSVYCKLNRWKLTETRLLISLSFFYIIKDRWILKIFRFMMAGGFHLKLKEFDMKKARWVLITNWVILVNTKTESTVQLISETTFKLASGNVQDFFASEYKHHANKKKKLCVSTTWSCCLRDKFIQLHPLKLFKIHSPC